MKSMVSAGMRWRAGLLAAAASAVLAGASPVSADENDARALLKAMSDYMGAQQAKEYGIVDSGDSVKLGINAMTDARQKSFFDRMVKSKVVNAGIDYKKAYTLQFVNKGVGVELRKP